VFAHVIDGIIPGAHSFKVQTKVELESHVKILELNHIFFSRFRFQVKTRTNQPSRPPLGALLPSPLPPQRRLHPNTYLLCQSVFSSPRELYQKQIYQVPTNHRQKQGVGERVLMENKNINRALPQRATLAPFITCHTT
jgi:hypothetical protein